MGGRFEGMKHHENNYELFGRTSCLPFFSSCSNLWDTQLRGNLMTALQMCAIVRSKKHQRPLIDVQRSQSVHEVTDFGIQIANDCCMVLSGAPDTRSQQYSRCTESQRKSCRSPFLPIHSTYIFSNVII